MSLAITRVVLYKHGVGYFEREGKVEGDAALSLTFRQDDVSDVLKSLTVLDLDGGHVASVSYDSTRPLEQLLQDVALSIPDHGSLVGLLPQIKGARIAVTTADATAEGALLGIDTTQRQSADGVLTVVLVSLLSDACEVRQFDLHALERLEILDASLRRDLDYYLRTQLMAKKKDARTFTFFARGDGARTVRLSYTLAAPVWKATYRILLGEEGKPPLIQGWAVVDNTQDEDWEGVTLSLVAGLPVSFVHDLYTPRYIRRPVVAVRETTGVLPPEVESGIAYASASGAESVDSMLMEFDDDSVDLAVPSEMTRRLTMAKAAAPSSMPAQVRERKLGDLFEYEIEHPVTIRRNQSALVPIVLRPFAGRPVLLHNRDTRPQNPMRCVELQNTTGLTLEGGPVTVMEGGNYVGEAMLETLKPDVQALLPYAVELSVLVLDNVESHSQATERVIIRNGVLTSHARQVRQTTYTFDNRGDAEQTTYLDHPRENAQYELNDTPDPVETTERYWRFRFALPAKKATRFVVRQSMTTSQSLSLSTMDTFRLSMWLKEKHTDAKTEMVLRDVLDEQNQLSRLEALLNRLNSESGTIVKEQQRIRENLGTLGDRSSEKELRERFVRSLNTQENRLEQIAAEVVKHSQERDAARARVNELLAGLEFEGGK